MPLVKGARLTGEGHKAAARGEAEYQQLVNRFEGHVHLSRGRPAAANARLKLLASSSSARRRSSGSRPMGSAPVPTGRRRIATPPPRDDELASPSDSDSDSDSPGEAGDPIGQPSKVQPEAPVFVVQGQHARAGREYGPEQKKESALSASKAAGRGGGTGGRVHEALGKVVAPVVRKKQSCQSDGGAAKRQQPRRPRPATVTDSDPKERKWRGDPPFRTKNRSRVPRARLLVLAARYKTNHDRVRAQRQEEADGGGAVPEGEYEIEQILCSDSDGALLVKWVGFGKPSWEPVAAIPAGAREAYGRQGHVELRHSSMWPARLN